MPENTRPRFLVRALGAAAAALLLTTGGLLVASPASAHDELVSTDPAADSTLDALPAQLTMTFSGDIATEPGANEIQVTDAAGTTLTSGDLSVQGNIVTQPLAGPASGAVTVLWKVVSSDGHPISGEYSFTVPTAVTPTETPTPTATPTPTESTEPSESPSPEETLIAPPAEEASSFGDVWPWVIGGIILIGLGGAVVYLLVSRARREKALAAGAAATGRTAPPGTPPTGSDTPTDR